MTIASTDKDMITEAAKGILQNCSSREECFGSDKFYRLDREVVIDLLSDLRKVLFPGYFGKVEPETAAEALEEQLTSVYERLCRQTVSALTCRCDKNDNTALAEEKARELCNSFFQRLPAIQALLMKDVTAAFEGDPAAKSKGEIILSYPGLYAVFVYRVAHELYVNHIPFLPRIMTEHAHSKTGIDINPGAVIGEYFFIDHGTGVVIGETCVIGNHVKLYQGVTLGALSTKGGQKLHGKRRHPTVEDNVTIYSGASILGGDTVIGENSVIGGNAFITESVAKNTRVTIKQPELKFREQ